MSSQDNFIDIPLYGSLEKRNLMAICKSIGYDVEGYEIDWLRITHVILKEAYCPALTSYITHDMEVGTLEKEIILSNNTALARLQRDVDKGALKFEYFDREHHKHVSSGHIKDLTLQRPWFSTVLDFSRNNANIAGIVVRIYFKGYKIPRRVVPHDLASLWNAMIGFQELPKEVVVMEDHPTKLFALYGKKFTGNFVVTKLLVDDVYVEVGDLILNENKEIVEAEENGRATAVRSVGVEPYTLTHSCRDSDRQQWQVKFFIRFEGEKGKGCISTCINGIFDPIHKEFSFTSSNDNVIGMVVDTSDITITSDNLEVKDEFIYDDKSEGSMLDTTDSPTTKRKKKIKIPKLLMMMHMMNQNMNKGDV